MADDNASPSPPGGGMDEIVSNLDNFAWNPQPQPPHPSNSQGLSFSVAGIGLGSSGSSSSSSNSGSEYSTGTRLPWSSAAILPSELLDSTLSLDFGGLGDTPGEEKLATDKVVPAVKNASTSREDRRGRLLVHYVGGSVTFLLQIAVLAWGVRQLRRVVASRRLRRQEGTSGVRIDSLPFRPVDLPLFSLLSPRALRRLVDLNHVPFLLIDVRHSEAARASPFSLDNVINIPEGEVRSCLQLFESLWESRFPAAKQPDKSDLLVFISKTGQRAHRSATVAAQLGFNGCCVLSGGIQTYLMDHGVSHFNALGRDAVAFLLQDAGQSPFTVKPHLIDVRRHDERALYGHISGSLHIPAEQWPKALAMEAIDWENCYHFTKFEKDDLLVLYSRTDKRAVWVSQLCSDAGMSRCYVYKHGTYGWRLDPTVLPYNGYEQGDAPPEPLKFEVDTLNREAAEIELRQKGLFAAPSV